MASDSITNVSIPLAASNSKDLVKKKKANRLAKLKQCKLDARREQWLSQVKDKGKKVEPNGRGITARSTHGGNESNRSENLEIKARGKDNDLSVHHYCELDSPADSPNSHTSSVLSDNKSGTSFTSSSSSSSSSSGGCCSGNITEEDEEEDDGCLDDWEAVADALAATDDKHEQDNPSSEPLLGQENIAQTDSHTKLNTRSASGIEILKPKQVNRGMMERTPEKGRAWRPDDAFRPPCLPNLLKQRTFPNNSDRHHGCGGPACGYKNVISTKLISTKLMCPICYEDLDFTDSSFLPCSCGFRLCLFCHKRILEEDGRCPGCRKQYENDPIEGEATLDGGSLTFRLARSCSMITRS